jgi:hypothetical protein
MRFERTRMNYATPRVFFFFVFFTLSDILNKEQLGFGQNRIIYSWNMLVLLKQACRL